ncbi:hypothetical protein QUA56_06065 [Microcoleus sp. N3A4]
MNVLVLAIAPVCDRRTRNVYVLAGYGEDLECEIVPNGEVF